MCFEYVNERKEMAEFGTCTEVTRRTYWLGSSEILFLKFPEAAGLGPTPGVGVGRSHGMGACQGPGPL